MEYNADKVLSKIKTKTLFYEIFETKNFINDKLKNKTKLTSIRGTYKNHLKLGIKNLISRHL